MQKHLDKKRLDHDLSLFFRKSLVLRNLTEKSQNMLSTQIDDGDEDDGEEEEEDGRGMAGRLSRGWEEYEPCGIGLTSHSLPSATQDM